MKLTKTEQYLLDMAKQRGHYSIEVGGGRGPEGGKISYGTRERNAMLKLEDKGLIQITSRNSFSECNRGYTVRSTIFCFKIVDKP